MPTDRRPRRGSLAFVPRKRAKRIYPRIHNWPEVKEVVPLAFPGYKVGMTHVMAIDNRPGITKGEEIMIPVTILETPPVFVWGLRFYKEGYRGAEQVIKDVFSENLPKYLDYKIPLPKKELNKNVPENFDDVRFIIVTQPYLTNLPKKKPEILEIPIGGENPEEKLKFAEQFLGKEMTVKDVFKEGELVDTIGVTKGKGFQGVIKRYGVKRLPHKTEKKRRTIGNHGPETPWRILPLVIPMPGQMGYHRRTELNKWLLKIGENGEEINRKGGWIKYGVVKNQWVMLKGSVQGPSKRMIVMRKAIRPDPRVPNVPPEIKEINLESQQGK
jgi:large subunit ribosomal protein L3